jgi:hypothetical protein
MKYNVKYRLPKNPLSGMSFLKRDLQFDSFEDAAKRADSLLHELPKGTEIFVCDGNIWVEKHYIPFLGKEIKTYFI